MTNSCAELKCASKRTVAYNLMECKLCDIWPVHYRTRVSNIDQFCARLGNMVSACPTNIPNFPLT